MSNENKQFTISFKCNEAFYRALILMLRHAEYLGCGMSREITIYFDGDGRDRIKLLEISESVPKSTKGQQNSGNFYLDTDEVFHKV